MENIMDITTQLLEASTATLALIFGLGVMCFAAYCLRIADKRGDQDDKKR